MRAILDVPAPAKLNLFLHVTGQRADGYHLLQSAFMLVDWCDTLHFEVRGDEAITREDLGAALPAEDLVVRAARALRSAAKVAHGVHIAIDKRIPAEAGLGGGSSDAASTLLALNRLWGTRLGLAELERIGLALGADVPFFLRGTNAWVEGIGEKLEPIELPPARFLVAKPAEGLATRAIFADPTLKGDSDAATITGFAANPYRFGRNDLQPVAERQCPGIGQALRWLASQGLEGRMTGSGSAVFALTGSGPQVSGRPPGRPAVAPDGWQVRECGNMEAHPLAGWAFSDDSSVDG
ncbi:MAG TPA: 4-(cytidine 5'-diphospho)-2-C-methyl-D-erythritol kinase [Ramlibacter sp.]|uniref:4-(cytidine 5'-diphospho)-2-C-methyl-D-erythritol kinase n=1 Tax=Ramlibacter sp. TaxID=1917967 RepID=UPI002C861710|nr:4-(cytidine 5'-diphospho)-2-C-methyl-D-erythritol kinase [Ramlibacter sp.]HVZ44574.1 4-(cytidine 5'-diphospho)-2-C-methyl-D-erythritol kinase [Ramlibacter sp.]